MSLIHATISAGTIREAHQRIKPYVHRTPVLTNSTINAITGAEVFFKCENFQKIGAFKARGAVNAVLQLNEQEAKAGVATHSSGNHAQAIAYAATLRNIQAYIVMPENAPNVKRKAVEGYGAKVIPCTPTLQAREDTVKQVMNDTGATFIHPFNNDHVITGQATSAVELLEQTEGLDRIMTPVGGGGLLGGSALAVAYFGENCKVSGAEPKGADDAYRSLHAGKLIPMENPDTIADGLLTSLGDKTFSIIHTHVEEIVTVSDNEIIDAMRLIWERMKIIVEPSCAVPLAALIQQKEKHKGQRVGIILTGGNVDLDRLPFGN
ncbi:pyridoxal-phosphate dependent enzyme [Roseivirga sp. BDSF3-8]|uniref:pyridoxal-phosphate dependent enzyme n=1 Tax=Roseivirga sp. BDSF3-8 TaxID=3241598 RepID=UPI003531F72F